MFKYRMFLTIISFLYEAISNVKISFRYKEYGISNEKELGNTNKNGILEVDYSKIDNSGLIIEAHYFYCKKTKEYILIIKVS